MFNNRSNPAEVCQNTSHEKHPVNTMKKQVIAINALSLTEGGGQTYLLNILRYAQQFPDMKIYVFSPPQFADLYAFPAVEVIPCCLFAKKALYRIAWERYKMPGLLKALEIDLVFCVGGTINFSPPSKCLTAITFQNMLIFDMAARQKYPLGYMRSRFALLEWLSHKNFNKADLVIFISEHANKVIDTIMPNRSGSSVIIPHGLEDKFRIDSREDIPRLKFLPNGDYLLYVSLIDFFKAHIEVVRAYHQLCQKRETNEKLLLVGPEHTSYGDNVRKEISRFGLEDKVVIIGNIPYTDMPSLYRNAKAHIFASTCENCPNILLESLASGRPLFVSNKPPMPEFAGDAAVYFDPYKPEELCDLLLRYLDDSQWLKMMGQKALKQSRLYSWESAATKTFEAMLNLKTGGLV